MARQPNPPSTVSQAGELRGYVGRLECPYELTGRDWDGPIYAELIELRQLNPGHRSPFIEDDSVRRPGWLCNLIYHSFEHDSARERRGEDHDPDDRTVIPFGRLTRPLEDLKDEWRDRPLLMLFRFVRFKTCFLAAANDHGDRGGTTFVEIPLEVYLVGQVVAYRPCSRLTFTTQSGARLRLTASFVCVVAIRQPATAPAAHVLIPCNVAWEHQICRDEFVVGWCHGVPATSSPNRRTPRFRSRWRELEIGSVNNDELQRQLQEGLVPAGSDTTFDFSSASIPVISEFGRILTVCPLDYVRKYIGPSGSNARRLDEDEDSDSDAPADVLAVGLSRGRPLPRDSPVIVCVGSPPQLTPPVPAQWLSGVLLAGGGTADISRAQDLVEGTAASTITAPTTSSSSPRAAATDRHPAAGMPSSSLGTLDTASANAQTMAVMLAMAQSTQKLVESTQKWIQEQLDRPASTGPAAPSRPILPASLPPTAERRDLGVDRRARRSQDRLHTHRNRRSRSPSPRRGHARGGRDRRSRSRHRDRSRSRSPGQARSRQTSVRLQQTLASPSRRHAYSPQ